MTSRSMSIRNAPRYGSFANRVEARDPGQNGMLDLASPVGVHARQLLNGFRMHLAFAVQKRAAHLDAPPVECANTGCRYGQGCR